MAAEASRRFGAYGLDTTMKLLCIHGERLQPSVHDGAIRCAGGETRILFVPRDVRFRELTWRLKEMTRGAEVLAIRHCLADDDGFEDDVLVSVTCDEELEHMREEYECLLATKPEVIFPVFVTTAAAAASSGSGAGGVVHSGRSLRAGLPPLPPKKRRAQSEQAPMHRGASYNPAPVRRVQSAQSFSFHHQQCCCCCCCCLRGNMCAPVVPRAS